MPTHQSLWRLLSENGFATNGASGTFIPTEWCVKSRRQRSIQSLPKFPARHYRSTQTGCTRSNWSATPSEAGEGEGFAVSKSYPLPMGATLHPSAFAIVIIRRTKNSTRTADTRTSDCEQFGRETELTVIRFNVVMITLRQLCEHQSLNPLDYSFDPRSEALVCGLIRQVIRAVKNVIDE